MSESAGCDKESISEADRPTAHRVSAEDRKALQEVGRRAHILHPRIENNGYSVKPEVIFLS
jgi:hypothetical protein